MPAPVLVAAVSTWAGVMPAATMFSTSVCTVQPTNWSPSLAAAVGPDADARAGGAQPGDPRGHPLPGGAGPLALLRCLAGEPLLQPRDLRRRHGLLHQRMHRVQPRRRHDPPRPAQRQQEEHLRPGLHQREQLVVDVLERVAEAVDAGPQQRLRVVERGGVHHHAQAAPVGLVDDRPIELRRELADRAAAIVDPRLDDGDAARRELPDRGPRLGLGRDAVGGMPHVVGPHLVGRRQAASGGEEARRIRHAAGADSSRTWYGRSVKSEPMAWPAATPK